jgi:hypothetical protein
MKKQLVALALLATGISPVFAQTNINTVSQVYTQNFDGLPTATVTGAFSSTSGTQAAISGIADWSGAKIAGSSTTGMSLIADNGTSNAGALFSYGATALGERALGLLASGSNTAAFGTSFVNNTGITLTSFTLDFTSEFWRSSTSTTNVLAFAYGISGGSVTASNYLSSAAMTAATALNVNGPAFVTTNGALDGNLSSNQALVSGTVALTWNPGQTLFIRWQDTDNVGSDAGLAIDNLTFTVIPEPSTYALLIGAAAFGVIAVRRSRKSALKSA